MYPHSACSIQIWDLESFGCLKKIEFSGTLWDLQFNDQVIAALVTYSQPETDNIVALIDWETMEITQKYKTGVLAQKMQLDSLKVVVGGHNMVGLSLENGLKVWELEIKSVTCFQYNNTTLIVGHHVNVSIYDMESGLT